MDLEPFKDRIRGREVSSDDTIGRYCRWVKRFEAWRPSDEPGEAMLRDFDSFLGDPEFPDYPWENSRGPSAPVEYAYQTRVTAISAAKLWLKFEYDTTVETKVQNIAVGEPEPFEPTVLEPSEVNRVIEGASMCSNDGCQTAVRVGYDAILRGAELASVRREDVDLDKGTLYVRAAKGSEPTNIQLSQDAINALRSHMSAHPDREKLFYNSYDNPWKADSWNAHFRRKHHEAGFHAFARHSAITNRLRQGADFGDVYLRARHQNPETTLKYVSLVGGDVPDWIDGR